LVPKTVYILGIVSFFTDISSEMIYPLLPVFLTQTLGAGPVALGIIEGSAEAISSFLKVVAGIWTDKVGKRKPFIVAGYLIASISRPLIAFAKTWHVVFALRFLDRMGKGIRTSPRDALIADVTSSEFRGSAYGIHRAMDHGGAIIGPLVASILLGYFGITLHNVFLLAAIPSLIGVSFLFLGIKESNIPKSELEKKPFRPIKDWGSLNPQFKIFLIAIFIFTLGNSTDAFLLLRLSQGGVSISWIPILWAILHIIKMTSTYFFGKITDSFGKKKMIITGWIYFSLIYFGLAYFDTIAPLIFFFLAYGIFFGLVEPAERALVAEIVPNNLRGTAFGYFHGIIGISSLPASILFGWIWQVFGAPLGLPYRRITFDNGFPHSVEIWE
jgi:MFS family permease